MNVKASVKPRCTKCQAVRRGTKRRAGILYIICKVKRHNQRQG